MRLAQAGLLMVALSGPVSAGEITPSQCAAVWRMVQFQARASLLQGKVLGQIQGTLAEETALPKDGITPAFRAKVELAMKIADVLKGLRSYEAALRTDTALPQGGEALQAACAASGK